ncbi:MAG: hypothetical protein WCW30_04480 [Candidatus Gracilibacteria bacterium]
MIPCLVLFLVLIVGSFYLESWIRRHPLRSSLKLTLPHVGGHLRAFGIVGFVLLWIRYENLPFISMRFLLVLFFLSFLAYVGRCIYRFNVVLPKIIEENKRLNKLKSYLPKKKK